MCLYTKAESLESKLKNILQSQISLFRSLCENKRPMLGVLKKFEELCDRINSDILNQESWHDQVKYINKFQALFNDSSEAILSLTNLNEKAVEAIVAHFKKSTVSYLEIEAEVSERTPTCCEKVFSLLFGAKLALQGSPLHSKNSHQGYGTPTKPPRSQNSGYSLLAK